MNGSIMKGLEYQIYMAVLMKEHMSMSEIQHECLNSPPRTVYRAVEKLVENRILEHGQVSLLLTLALDPRTCDTSGWPLHIFLNHWLSAGIWGGLDVALRIGAATPGEGSHVVALTFDDVDYPDWLPKTTVSSPWCSRVIMPLLEHSLKGDMPESEGVQLWPLETEPPKPYLEPDSVRVSLRGKPISEPVFRECELQGVGWGCQGKIEIKAASIVFSAYRFLIDRGKLQEEFDHFVAAGEVQITGRMENGGGGHELIPDVLVEHWAPVEAQS